MLEDLERACARWPADSLRIEHFVSTKGALDLFREHGFELKLNDSGITIAVPPDRTVLQVLRAANVDIQSDGEDGLCGSCEVRVLGGEINHLDVVLSRSERETHARMVVCCSRARGSLLVLEL